VTARTQKAGRLKVENSKKMPNANFTKKDQPTQCNIDVSIQEYNNATKWSICNKVHSDIKEGGQCSHLKVLFLQFNHF